MLSELINECDQRGDKETADLIAGISPLATSHIILGGYYTYEEDKDKIDIEDMIGMLRGAINH